MARNQFFRCFCINLFGIGPWHYPLISSDFGFEFTEIFVSENGLSESGSQRDGSGQNWLANRQTKKQEDAQAKFTENIPPSPFNKDLSNETNFSLIHLAGQYLKWTIHLTLMVIYIYIHIYHIYTYTIHSWVRVPMLLLLY
jgi:hypothetical protein